MAPFKLGSLTANDAYYPHIELFSSLSLFFLRIHIKAFFSFPKGAYYLGRFLVGVLMHSIMFLRFVYNTSLIEPPPFLHRSL